MTGTIGKSARTKRSAPKMPDPKRIKHVAILTGGGDCPGLNAAIRGVVRAAVNHIALGHYGHMVCLRENNIICKKIKQAIKNINLVDPEGQLVKTADALGITTGRSD